MFYIFHTPQFPHPALSTPRNFHTPHFPQSSFSTPRTPHFPPIPRKSNTKIKRVDKSQITTIRSSEFILIKPFGTKVSYRKYSPLICFPSLGNQGWPSVAYNIRKDEYFIAFQFRSGIAQYFSNKFIIISQRVRSAQTERAAGPSLLLKANEKGKPTNWIDSMKPLIKYNPVTGIFGLQNNWVTTSVVVLVLFCIRNQHACK